MDEQRELSTGYFYFLFVIGLGLLFFYLIGSFDGDEIVYTMIGEEYCGNNSVLDFNGTLKRGNLTIIRCGGELFPVREERIEGLINFVHYEVG